MKKKEVVRLYNFSDADLLVDADALKGFVERDATQFLTRNVQATTLDAYQALMNDVRNQPTDREIQGPSIRATEIKDSTLDSAKEAMRDIREIAKAVYHEKGLYNSFGFDDMDDLSDNKLFFLIGRVHRVATELQAELADEGLSQDMLDNLDALDDELLANLRAQRNAIALRDIATQRRIIILNRLYTEYARLSEIGKRLFFNNDEARYNDYTMYERRTHDANDGPDAPPAPSA